MHAKFRTDDDDDDDDGGGGGVRVCIPRRTTTMTVKVTKSTCDAMGCDAMRTAGTAAEWMMGHDDGLGDES